MLEEEVLLQIGQVCKPFFCCLVLFERILYLQELVDVLSFDNLFDLSNGLVGFDFNILELQQLC